MVCRIQYRGKPAHLASWGIKNWPMRGAINQFEGLLLEEIKSVLKSVPHAVLGTTSPRGGVELPVVAQSRRHKSVRGCAEGVDKQRAEVCFACRRPKGEDKDGPGALAQPCSLT